MVGGVMTLYLFFSRWPPEAILDFIWVMLEAWKAVRPARRIEKKGKDRTVKKVTRW